MALSENGMDTTMLVSPTAGYSNGGGLFGGNGDSWLGILFLIALCNGGFGFGGFGGGYGAMMGAGMMGMDYLYPWLNNSQNINDGFREQMLSTQVNGIQNSITSGFGDIQTALCGGFAGVNQNISNGVYGLTGAISGAQNAISQQLYGNEIASLERSFNAQTANTAGLTNLSSQLANCCCENRAATQDLKYTLATEACATREANTANTQAILDKLCALELDTVKSQLAQAQRDNVGLQNQLNMANLAASQVAQTATILQGQNNEIDALVTRLNNCPIPSTPVYGKQNIFTCGGNTSCGCGSF